MVACARASTPNGGAGASRGQVSGGSLRSGVPPRKAEVKCGALAAVPAPPARGK